MTDLSKLRYPERISGHIVAGADHRVWACYAFDPWPYTVGSEDERLAVLEQIEELVSLVPSRAIVQGIAQRCSESEVRAGVATTSKAVPSPRWDLYQKETVKTTKDVYVRSWFVFLELADEAPLGLSFVNDLKEAWARNTAKRRHEDWCSDNRMEAWAAQSRHLVARFGFAARRFHPMTEAEVCWLYARAFRRGGSAEPALSDIIDLHTPSPGDCMDVQPMNPGRKNRVRSGLLEGGPVSENWSTAIVLTDLPRDVTLPGSEHIYRLNLLGFPVDVSVLIETMPASKAAKKTSRRKKNVEGEDSNTMMEHERDLAEALEEMELRKQPLVLHTHVFYVGADSVKEMEARASQVQGLFGNHWRSNRRRGVQEEMIVASLPGMTWPKSVMSRADRQATLADMVAASGVACGTQVGDPQGILLGYRAQGLGEPVLFDPAWGPTREPNPTSGSMALIGATGSGKGVTAKVMAHGALSAGHKGLFIDRSTLADPMEPSGRIGEWVRFARASGASYQIVTLGQRSSGVTIDPFVSLPKRDAIEAAHEYLSLLCGVENPTDSRALMLSDAVRAIAEYKYVRLSHVIDWLEYSKADDPIGKELLSVLRAHKDASWASSVFGDGEPLSMKADATVVWVPDLKLPSRNKEEKVTLAQIGGQAALLLIARIGQHLLRSNSDRYSFMVLDEVWALFQTSAGREWIASLAREGRKEARGVWLMSQQPEDIPEEVLSELGYIGVMRCKAIKHSAALRVLGLSPESDASLLLSGEESGYVLWRDCRGRVGLVHVEMPQDEILAKAFNTTPLKEEIEEDSSAPVLAGVFRS